MKLTFALAASLACLVTPAWAATITVTSLADSGAGTLRAAIESANATPGADTINFNLPGGAPYTINLTSELPEITQPVTIDGASQPGYAGKPLIELNGFGAGAYDNGLFITGGQTRIRGLVINRFHYHGILIAGGGNNVVENCFIGSDPSGTTSQPNGQSAVAIAQSSKNLIGGLNSNSRNILSGRNHVGVYIAGDTATSNLVQGNFIGTDITGKLPLGSLSNGVLLAESRFNVIGGAEPGARNVISANYQSGVYLFGPKTLGNVVAGNFIGVDVTGAAPLGNFSDGVTIYDCSNNVIGGTTFGSRNIISGNKQYGVFLGGTSGGNRILGNYIGTDLTGSIAISNYYSGVGLTGVGVGGNFVGGIEPGAGNLISGNLQHGVRIFAGGSANSVAGNYIGLAASGTQALANQNGVAIDSSPANQIGPDNVISGNRRQGIFIGGAASADNVIQGNYLGTDPSGASAVPNVLAGITIDSAPDTVIGGSASHQGNLISGNGKGIFIAEAAAAGTVIQGNFIGLNAAGNDALPNMGEGIFTVDVPNTIIGGAAPGAGNFISGNLTDGIYMTNSMGSVVQGNFIGTDPLGTFGIGNGFYGVTLDGGSANLVGGSTAGTGNLISGNGYGALWLVGPDCRGNQVKGNYIGTAADGLSLLPNAYLGILIEISATENVIGGWEPGAGNTIAYNDVPDYDGIRIKSGNRNLIAGNSIFAHVGLGIDLGVNGVTANDAVDADTGANNLQNFPVIDSAANGSGNTVIRGTLNSARSQSFRLEFFANPACNISGHGEGQYKLGTLDVTTSGSGNYNFSYTFPGIVPAGYTIAATASDASGNTSEFSACRAVTGTAASADLQITKTLSPNPVVAGQSLTATITVRNNGASDAFGVRVNDLLPANTVFTSSFPTPTARFGNNLSFDLGRVAAGSVATITVHMRPLMGGGFSESVGVTSAIADPTLANNSATATAQVIGPPLQIARNGSAVVVSWPAEVLGFGLEQTWLLGPDVFWSPVDAAPIAFGGLNHVSVPAAGDMQFFRLQAP